MAPIPVIHLGLGPIGQAIGKAVAEEGRLISVGAVDTDPAIRGRQLQEICDAGLEPLTVVETLAATQAPAGSVALQATVSSLTAASEQLFAAIALGYHVVSTCEELVWPWDDQPRLAAELDRAARKAGVTILGVGVNPGFVMDALPVLLSRATTEIEAIHISRIVDIAQRRLPLQSKMGVGRQPAEVQSLLDEEKAGHVGLSASLRMLAAGLGWRLDVIDLVNRPIVARTPTETGLGVILPGQCIGVRQQAIGMASGMPRIILTLLMEAQVAGGSRDEIVIDGDQSLRLRIDGLQGDLATAALVINQALHVRDLPPGLQTMLSAPLLPRLPT